MTSLMYTCQRVARRFDNQTLLEMVLMTQIGWECSMERKSDGRGSVSSCEATFTSIIKESAVHSNSHS